MEERPMKEEYEEIVRSYALPESVLPSCRCVGYRAGETISMEGQTLQWLQIVVRGRLKVCTATPDGKNLILCYYVSGGILGDVEYVTDVSTATATVVAITDTDCIRIPFHILRTECSANAAFYRKLGVGLAEKMLRNSDVMLSAFLCTGEERLCAYILQNSHGEIFSDTLTDAACSVGLSYRHMFRLLGQLCREGILEKREKGYRIRNRSELEARAGAAMRGYHSSDRR